eukprot:CAMPEP_0168580162 /NCGR_PEP_ID=MMETSP0420-20121227/641_1 /TAXON_ID=498008 /ORGANISM="Pessonella sp." /LENGTH=349 /DNA_ID=CAMNT_0008614243 /DNA_START=82 /DNA_END=1131 /DNA_ORIENTATION=-
MNPLKRIPSIGSDMDDETLYVKEEDVDVKSKALPESIFEGSSEHEQAKKHANGRFVKNKVDECMIFYRHSGNKNAPQRFLFITGLNSTHEAWFRQETFFSTGNSQCIVMDNRGCGFSDSPDSAYSTDLMAQDVIAVVDDCWPNQTFVVIGQSLGGMVAQKLALHIPKRIKAMVLMCTRVYGGFWTSLPTWTGIYKFIRMKMANDGDTELNRTLEWLFPADYLNQPCNQNDYQYNDNRAWLFDVFRNRKGAKSEQGSKAQLDAATEHHLTTDEINRIVQSKIRIIVIHGSEDLVVTFKNSQYTADAFKVPLTVLDGCGHAVAIQCAEILNQMLIDIYKADDVVVDDDDDN